MLINIFKIIPIINIINIIKSSSFDQHHRCRYHHHYPHQHHYYYSFVDLRQSITDAMVKELYTTGLSLTSLYIYIYIHIYLYISIYRYIQIYIDIYIFLNIYYSLFSTDKILDDDLVLVTHRRSQKKYACKGIASSFFELLHADFSIIVFSLFTYLRFVHSRNYFYRFMYIFSLKFVKTHLLYILFILFIPINSFTYE